MLNIGMILDNEFVGDMRVENEIMSLSKAGYKVYLLCFNHSDKPNHELFHGAEIIRLNISLFRKNKMKGFTNTFFDLYTIYWSSKISSFVKKYKIDVLHVHDLYMLGAAFKAKKNNSWKIPIIGDLHENYPEALKHYKYTKTFPGKYVVSIPKWEKTEIEWINKADHIITVIEEAVLRYSKLGADTSKISVVANYVNQSIFASSDTKNKSIDKFKGKFVISYLGGFDLHRGLESVIKSLVYVKNDIPNIHLVLVGTGRIEQDLKQLAISLEVDHLISFEGWQHPENLPSYILASSICLIPHLKTVHTDNTIPHKLFQYMYMKRPVISSNCDPLKRIVEESNSGLVYESNNEEDLANKIKQLYDNVSLRQEMALNGHDAVLEKYNWDATAQNLIQLYQRYH